MSDFAPSLVTLPNAIPTLAIAASGAGGLTEINVKIRVRGV
jgi:hypothetical protein